MTIASTAARKLSQTQKEFLFDHIDGIRPTGNDFGSEHVTRSVLINLGLIRYAVPEKIAIRPRGTLLTDLGREAVCIVLGQYADALVKAKCLKEAPIIALPPKLRHPFARAHEYAEST